MDSDQRRELLLKRSEECELLAQVATDASIRSKCAELAVEYRTAAERLIPLHHSEDALS
jgi:hypothetical protein